MPNIDKINVHRIDYDVHDSSVPEWAREEEKPDYTAEEVTYNGQAQSHTPGSVGAAISGVKDAVDGKAPIHINTDGEMTSDDLFNLDSGVYVLDEDFNLPTGSGETHRVWAGTIITGSKTYDDDVPFMWLSFADEYAGKSEDDQYWTYGYYAGDDAYDAENIQYDGTLSSHEPGSVGEALSQQSSAIAAKQTAPSAIGTAGQVLGLDSSLLPAWLTVQGGGGGGEFKYKLVKSAANDTEEPITIDFTFDHDPMHLLIVCHNGSAGIMAATYYIGAGASRPIVYLNSSAKNAFAFISYGDDGKNIAYSISSPSATEVPITADGTIAISTVSIWSGSYRRKIRLPDANPGTTIKIYEVEL